LECCDLSQLFNVEWLSTKSGGKLPHSKEWPLSMVFTNFHTVSTRLMMRF
jgi:hypothetical protein